MTVVKPNIGPHAGEANNLLSFDRAYDYCAAHPDIVYKTTGNEVDFTPRATVGKRGGHQGKKVLRFMFGKQERSRAYECCWGYKTNCNRAYIDCYTEAITLE